MKDRDRTKEQLIKELEALRSKLAKLDRMENKDKQDDIMRLVETGRDITKRKRIDERIEIMNECFSRFVPDPAENINNLTALCGKLLGATCALYNRLDGDMLCSVGQWQTPQDYNPIDKPDGHICYDVIKRGGDKVFIVHNLLQSHYAKTDPYVTPYKLQTYIGMRVKYRGDCVGSICAVYQKNFIPSESDKKLLGIIASAIGVEEERKQAEEELCKAKEELEMRVEERTKELKAANKKLNRLTLAMARVEENERKRLAEVLHENIGQNLVAMKIACESGENVSDLVPLINATIQSTRSLTTDLYPPVLDKNNLINALEWYVRSVLKSKDIKVSLDIDPAVDELNDDFKKDIYRIIRECFQNIVKHSSASSVKVKIKKVKDCFQIKVQDNGVGFSIKGSKVKSGEGIGLKLMREWVKSLNGRFNIKSQPGKGTEITIELPDEKSKEQNVKTRKKKLKNTFLTSNTI